MFSSFGPTELIIVLVIVLLIFGPKRLPGLGRSLGSGMREFRDSITGRDRDDDEARSLSPARTDPEVVSAETGLEEEPMGRRQDR